MSITDDTRSAETIEAELPDMESASDPDEASAIRPLISLAAALLDTDRVRIAGLLAEGPANRIQLSERTGLSHKELLRQLDILQGFDLVKYEEPAPRHPDPYTPYVLNKEAFRAARQAMGKHKGVKPRPKDARLLALETFLPGGKLTAFPLKHDQLVAVLDEVARKFPAEKQYTEREVNVILEEVNEDYCTLRRYLVDYGYFSRSGGIYTKNS